VHWVAALKVSKTGQLLEKDKNQIPPLDSKVPSSRCLWPCRALYPAGSQCYSRNHSRYRTGTMPWIAGVVARVLKMDNPNSPACTIALGMLASERGPHSCRVCRVYGDFDNAVWLRGRRTRTFSLEANAVLSRASPPPDAL
jgi:hypothetical protein